MDAPLVTGLVSVGVAAIGGAASLIGIYKRAGTDKGLSREQRNADRIEKLEVRVTELMDKLVTKDEEINSLHKVILGMTQRQWETEQALKAAQLQIAEMLTREGALMAEKDRLSEELRTVRRAMARANGEQTEEEARHDAPGTDPHQQPVAEPERV